MIIKAGWTQPLINYIKDDGIEVEQVIRRSKHYALETPYTGVVHALEFL